MIEEGEVLRELVILRSERDSLLSSSDEEQLLETAVTQLNMPLSMAKGIIITSADSAGIEIESDINRVVEAMMLSMAGQQKAISSGDFELIAKYYSRNLRKPLTYARSRLKEIVNRSGVVPRRGGFLFSARWFRSIRPISNPVDELGFE